METTTARPLRLSWSRLRLHTECPAKGALIAAGKKSPVSDYRNFFPGTVTDRCMRQWLQSSDSPERGWMRAQVDRVMDEEERNARESGDGIVKWKHASDRQEVREMCLQAVHQLEEDLWTELHLWKPPAFDWDAAPRFEVPITIPHPKGHREKIFLVGEIDLLIRRPFNEKSSYDLYQFPGERPETVVEVWDLKTTRDNQYWRKTLGQLIFYEIAVWGMTRQWPVCSGLFQPLCDETTPMWQFTMDHRTQMLQRIVSVAGDIWAGRLDPKPEKSRCGMCEVRHACPLKGSGRGRVSLSAPVSGA